MRQDIPVNTLAAMYEVVKEAQAFLGPREDGKPEDSLEPEPQPNAYQRLVAAVERLNAVKDGPVWECRCRSSCGEEPPTAHVITS